LLTPISVCYRGGNTIPIIPHCVTLSDFSLGNNELGPEGGIAIAYALKVNSTIKDIKYVAPSRVNAPSHLLPPR
jgi:hypothetical protein